jgi:hypothetical protein
MRVAGILAAVVVAAVVGVSAIAAAQAPPPTITVTATESSLTLSSTGPLAAGPTRFAVERPTDEDVELTIGALREGVTVAEFTAALRSNPNDAIEMAHLDGGVSIIAGQANRAFTANLRPSSTYVAVNLTGENPNDWEIVEFSTSGTSNGASAPQADARVRIVDLRFRGAKTLPRNGVVRFENAGWAPHFALAAPLKAKAKQRAVARALRRNRNQALERLLDFRRSVEPQSLITRGAVNYNEVRFPKRGRYVMVCFFEGHSAQGMFRFVRVR